MEIDPELPSGSSTILITMSRTVTGYEAKDNLQVRVGDTWLTPNTITEQGDNYVITYTPANVTVTIPKDGSDAITCTPASSQTVEEIIWGAHPAIYHRANTETASSGDFVVDNDGKVILSEDGLAISKTSITYNFSDQAKSKAVAALYGVSPIVFEVSGSYAHKDETLNAYGQTWAFAFSSGMWVVSPALEAYTE